MSNKKSTVPEAGYVGKGTSYNFLGAVFRSLLGFLYVFALAKILSVDEVGLFFLGVNIITFATILAIGGMDTALRRYMAVADSNKDAHAAWNYFFTAAAISLVLSAILGGGLYLSSDFLAVRVFEKEQLGWVMRGLLPFLVLYAMCELLLSVTQGYRHMKYWVLSLDVVNSGLRIVLSVALSFLGLTLAAAIVGYSISIAVAFVMAVYFFLKVIPPKPAGAAAFRFREVATFSFPVALARLVNSGNGIVETMLLGYFLVASDVGIYNVAFKIAAMGTIILASFNTTFAPVISKMQHESRLDELQKLFSCVTRWTFAISLPLFLLIAWYSAPIMNLFGEEYVGGAMCVVVLCLGQIINSVTGASGNLVLMSGYTYTTLLTNVGGLVLSVVFNVLLIPVYGVVGSALAVGLALAVVNLVRVFFAWKFLGMHPYNISYWKPVAAGGLMLALLAVVGPHHLESMNVGLLVAACAAGALAYAAALYLFGLEEADRYVLDKLRSRLSPR